MIMGNTYFLIPSPITRVLLIVFTIKRGVANKIQRVGPHMWLFFNPRLTTHQSNINV